MDFRYRFLTFGIPWTQSMSSRDVNAATRLAEARWRRDNVHKNLVSYFTQKRDIAGGRSTLTAYLMNDDFFFQKRQSFNAKL